MSCKFNADRNALKHLPGNIIMIMMIKMMMIIIVIIIIIIIICFAIAN
jgi:hypothetical protein